MKLRTISALISSALAVLLFSPDAALAAQDAASDAALAAQEDATEPFDIKYTVSQYGWHNLRKIDSSTNPIPQEFWYVCGARKIIAFPKKDYLDSENFELIERAPNREFEGDHSSIIDFEEFQSDSKYKDILLKTAISSCSASPKYDYPELFYLSSANRGNVGNYNFLLPRDFQVKGSIRSFWLNEHPARKDKKKVLSNSAFFDVYKEHADTFGDYINGVESWWVSEDHNSVAQIEVNCASSEVRFINKVDYNTDGSVRYSMAIPGKYEAIIPGSIADSWREAVCLIK